MECSRHCREPLSTSLSSCYPTHCFNTASKSITQNGRWRSLRAVSASARSTGALRPRRGRYDVHRQLASSTGQTIFARPLDGLHASFLGRTNRICARMVQLIGNDTLVPRSDVLSGVSRIDLYLSGGGFRAALGALGAIYFLRSEGQWSKVSRIVSVSGGGIVSSRLAAYQPDPEEIPDHIKYLFNLMARWSGRWLLGMALFAAIISVMVALAATITYVISPPNMKLLASLLLAVVVLAVSAVVLPRLALRILYRYITGNHRFGELVKSHWNIDHIFVSTDLATAETVFLSANSRMSSLFSPSVQCTSYPDLKFSKALRASTAFPPLVPPTRVRVPDDPDRLDEPPLRSIWLIDGGVSGNLGTQLDPRISPENAAALTLAQSRWRAGPSTGVDCSLHPEFLAWYCQECTRRSFIIDCSGVRPKPSTMIGIRLNTPVLGALYHTLRTLSVMYAASLSTHQETARESLIGVVRSDQLVKAIVGSRNARDIESGNPHRQMGAAGAISQFEKLLQGDDERHKLARRVSLTQLEHVCWHARSGAARIPTGLWPVGLKRAAICIASGYLNMCLAVHGSGRDAMEVGIEGLRALAEELGVESELRTWWRSVEHEYNPPKRSVDPHALQ